MSLRITLIALAMWLPHFASAALTCNTTINSFPYFEDFAANFGDFENVSGDDFDWSRTGLPTPSVLTGPDGGYLGGWYLFTEASAPNNPGKTAILHSPCFDLDGLVVPYFTFRYHMYGVNMGELSVEVSTDEVNWYQQFFKSGDQGDVWREGVVDLSGFANATIKIRFKVTTGSGFRSDIGLDQFEFYPIQNCAATIATFPYIESFESGIGDFRQDYFDDFEWTRQSGPTASVQTGPNSASDGSYYLYTEASAPNHPYKTAIIKTPCFDLREYPEAEFSFDYHMYGVGMGELTVEYSENGVTWGHLWSKSGNQGNQWLSQTISLNAFSGKVVMLRFRGQTATNYRSDMAIDNIRLETCKHVQVDITFDAFSQETTWDIVDDQNNVVAAGGPYPSAQYAYSFLRITECLPDGCYKFTIYDSFGDGICCSQGNGRWDISYEETTYYSPTSGDFGISEKHEFCLGASGNKAANTTHHGNATNTASEPTASFQPEKWESIEVFPNPARDRATLRYTATAGGAAQLQVVDLLGRVVRQSKVALQVGVNRIPVDLQGLSEGQYVTVLYREGVRLSARLQVLGR